MSAPPLITLTTDFGLRDAYVASMKGVILSIAPRAQIIDISHDIEPQDVAGAAYVLSLAGPYFPTHTVHVAVVDPGVGTSRLPIAVESGHGRYVGPDNGILVDILAAQGTLDRASGRLLAGRAVALSNELLHSRPISPTFHGRDVFAPVAAHLAAGVPFDQLGEPVDCLRTILGQELRSDAHGLAGVVRAIDRFGNAITNIPGSAIPARPVITIGEITLRGLAGNYQEQDIVALIGSAGYLEIAARNGSAASRLDLKPGDPVSVQTEQ